MKRSGICRARSALVLLGVVLLASNGCALFQTKSAQAPAEMGDGEPMDQTRMEMLFGDEVDAIVGPPGAIQTRLDNVPLYLISDAENDRMRLIAPIARLDRLDPRVVPVLLDANFDSTRDARYALSDGVIYSIYLHRISTLSPTDLKSAVGQVVSLVKTFGTTFSSGVSDLGGPSREGP